jgi:hypothetical protein
LADIVTTEEYCTMTADFYGGNPWEAMHSGT